MNDTEKRIAYEVLEDVKTLIDLQGLAMTQDLEFRRLNSRGKIFKMGYDQCLIDLKGYLMEEMERLGGDKK